MESFIDKNLPVGTTVPEARLKDAECIACLHILLVEDNLAEARHFQETTLQLLGTENGKITHVELLSQALAFLGGATADVILLKLTLPDSTGVASLERLIAVAGQIPIIVFTECDDEVTGTEAVHKGAQDYLVKGELNPRLLVRLIQHVVERKRAEQALVKERANLTAIFDMVNVGMLLVDQGGAVKRINNTVSRWVGKDLAKSFNDQPGDLFACIHVDGDEAGCGHTPYCSLCPIRRAFALALRTGQPVHGVEAEVIFSVSGQHVPMWIEVSADPVVVDGKWHAILAMNNISSRKRAEREREITISFLHLVNASSGMRDLLDWATSFFQEQSLCQAAAIRLKEEPHFSYNSARGFSKEFLAAQSAGCAPFVHRKLGHDDPQNLLDACMCDQVITGGDQSHSQYFTAYGSFWTNSMTRMIAANIDQELKTHSCRRCQREGYESVALIPLRVGDRRLGLVQLNDRREGMFSEESINLWERLADYLAVALARLFSEETLQRSLQRFELLAQTSAELLQTSRPQEVVNSLCRSVMEHMDCHAFFNYLVDPIAGRLRLNAYAGIEPAEAQRIEWLDFGVAVCGCAARDGERIVAEHIQTSSDTRADLVRGYGIQAYAAHPLLGPGGEVLGTLSFGTRSRRTFCADELTLMKAVADQVAVAIARVRGEEDLAQAKVLAEAANQAKSIFLANMSHEIRTPLGAILGFSEFLAEPELGAEDRVRFNEIISRSGAQLSALIDDILDLSRVESGSLTLEISRVSLSRLLEDVQHVVGVAAEAKAVTFQIRKGWIPEAISSDGIRLQQILTNIIGNAIKFTPSGGVVTLGVDTDREKRAIVFMVSDTGIGIAPENHQKIFKPFTQAELGTTRKFGGTGLGLTLSRNLAQALGGDLTLRESTPGRGSTFVIRIAAMGSEEPMLPSKTHGVPVDAPRKDLQGMQVLLAEDTEVNVVLVSRLLGSRGAQVDVVGNGRDAVVKALSKKYSAILMDVRMPVMDGLTATRELRAQGYKAPIIALTANALKEERDASLAAGCTAHLSKPINFNELIGMLRGLH